MTWWGWLLVAVFGWPAAALGLGLFLGRVFQLPTHPTPRRRIRATIRARIAARRIDTDHQHLTESHPQ